MALRENASRIVCVKKHQKQRTDLRFGEGTEKQLPLEHTRKKEHTTRSAQTCQRSTPKSRQFPPGPCANLARGAGVDAAARVAPHHGGVLVVDDWSPVGAARQRVPVPDDRARSEWELLHERARLLFPLGRSLAVSSPPIPHHLLLQLLPIQADLRMEARQIVGPAAGSSARTEAVLDTWE